MMNTEKMREAKLEDLASAALSGATDVPAIEFEKQWISRRTMSALAEQVQGILDKNRISSGARVSLIARNHPAIITAFIALIAAQMNIRMTYPFQSASGIAKEIDEVSPDVVIALDGDFSDPVREVMKRCGTAAIALENMSAKGISELVNNRAKSGPNSNLTIEILTSGTTGKPKPFLISFDMVAKHLIPPVAADAVTQEPVLLYFPVGNISGLYTTLPAALSGRRIVLLDRFSVGGWHDFVLRFRPTAGGVPPAGIQMILDANIPKEDLSSIRFFGVGAAPLDIKVQRDFEARYGIPILLSYGATEFGGPVTRMTPEMYQKDGHAKLGTVGKPLPGVRLRVVDSVTFEELPAGVEGLLEVISPRIGDRWIRTSDLAVVDQDGYLFHRGRADGVIIRGGFKILPETVENALLTHSAVSAAAVVGIADHRLGQVPAAAIVLKPGQHVTEQELDQFLREKLLATHIPTKWLFAEELPRTKLSFKVDQLAVRNLFSEAMPVS
ncbi:class I adenylate-forming enzyme family protein [Zhongshania aquimaris]|uniref:Fatty acid--CoA ligase family protein n=1 Tax=Zhongshania aquimaris TaxID=2857107 RepID=A0ABS6VWL1_9GAMM|nr:fatty acid--CoA ligase family protein [Zhongshania aquimaris]MBW2942724.1 fatty acid--CoA ligase family protein [Zhongshania aquimaris]